MIIFHISRKKISFYVSPAHTATSGTPVLESAALEGGRLLNGSGTDKVLYYVTDHLGSVRVVKDGSGTIRQRFDYYPFGTVSRVYTSSSSTDYSLKRYRFGGKEIAGAALTELGGTGAAPAAPYLDFDARLYSPRTATWLSVDPMAEKYYGIGPHVYCAASPMNLVDPTGNNIYRYDENTGQLILVEENDDNYDQIGQFRYDRTTGEFSLKTRKDGSARVFVDKIEKGILNEKGMNFFKDTRIAVGGEGGPSIEGVERFLLDFSNYIDKELGGYYVSESGQDVQYVTIGNISRNTSQQAFPGSPYSVLKSLPEFNIESFNVILNYHTHLSRFPDDARLRPSSSGVSGGDLGFKARTMKYYPYIQFRIITNPNSFNY